MKERGIGSLIFCAVLWFVGLFSIPFGPAFRCELCVTNARVMGKTADGELISIPHSQITNISTKNGVLSIKTTTSSVEFAHIKNLEIIFHCISNLNATANKGRIWGM